MFEILETRQFLSVTPTPYEAPLTEPSAPAVEVDADAGGEAAAKVSLSDLHFTKKLDKASPKLF